MSSKQTRMNSAVLRALLERSLTCLLTCIHLFKQNKKKEILIVHNRGPGIHAGIFE